MSNEGRQLNHHDRQEWAKYHKEQVAQGNFIRRGGMKLVKDSAGGWYKANGNSCCGCGHNQQMELGKGSKARAGKPPTLKGDDGSGGGLLSWLFGGK